MPEPVQGELISDEALADRLRSLPTWNWEATRKGISRSFVFADFKSAFAFMVEVAEKAEHANHHPEWCNVWNRVEILLTTHSSGGVTGKDFALALEIERLFHGCPPGGSSDEESRDVCV